MPDSLGSDYFRDVYESSNDPWGFATSPYEHLKYMDTLSSLPSPVYRNALEIGCSIGVLTERLARRCERLLATDVSTRALAAAKRRCERLANVSFRQSAAPTEYPDEAFDLTVLSEVGYYWSRSDLTRAADQMVEHLSRGGQLMLVHWTPVVEDYPLTGDEVHDHFLGLSELQHLHGHCKETYRLDLLQKK